MDSEAAPRPFPGFAHLYEVGQSYGTFRGRLECDRTEALALTRAEIVPSRPIPLRYEMGRTVPSDVMWSGAIPIIVHRRIIDLLVDHGFTGWGTYPVQVYGKKGELFEDYLGVSFTGRCGPIDASRSERFMVEMPGGLVPHWRGLYFDEDSWDGSDLFMCADQTGVEFVTEDVMKALKKAKVKGLTFEALDSIELGFDPGE